MMKLCLNTRDELLIVDLSRIAYFQANGNYTQIMYIKGQQQMIVVGLSKIEEYIKRTWPKEKSSPFIRMGRSLIINQNYLYSINTLRQKLVLSDFSGHVYTLTVPKCLLKEYKKQINDRFSVSK